MLTYIGIYHSLPALSDAPCYSACIAVRASLWLTRRHRHTMSQKAQPNTAKSNQSVCLEILPPPTSSRQQKKEHKHKQTRKEKNNIFSIDLRFPYSVVPFHA